MRPIETEAEVIPPRRSGWMHQESAGQRARFAWLIAGIFLILTVPRLLLHEMWRDEAWLWLVVTGSRSVGELVSTLGRSGQGYLFPLLCFLVGKLWDAPQAMQLLNLLVASTATWIFVRWARFPRLERALLAFGYLPFYEYAVISRHYALGVLLLWWGCAAVCRHRVLLLGAAMALLCQTTVYGYILAVALGCGWLFDRWRDRTSLPGAAAAGGLVLAVAGAVAGVIQLIPAAGTSFAPGWHFAWDSDIAARVLRIPWRAFVPVPIVELEFWNTNVLDPWPRLQTLAGALTLLLATVMLRRRKGSLVTFFVGASGLLAFAYIKLVGEIRHNGHFWLLFVAALWLGGGSDWAEGRRNWRSRALLMLAILHSGSALFASWMDVRHPFSNGAATAELIRRTGLDRHPLVGHREPPAASVALALGQPLYSPSRRIFAAYPDWGPRQREVTSEELRCAARHLARREGEDIVIVSNGLLPQWAELDAAGSRVGAIMKTENYFLYVLRRDRLPPTENAARCPDSVDRTH